METLKQKIARFPRRPGVYFFLGAGRKILYVGKATSLRDRVRSYFSAGEERENALAMRPHIVDVKFEETDTVLEALILEANLIKKHQPPYNFMGKDDKSFSYFAVTREDFPRVLIVRESDLGERQAELSSSFGPYTSKKQMAVALDLIRRIFPFHAQTARSEKGCLDFQIGKCPGPFVGKISKADYRKNIVNIRKFLAGKKQGIIREFKNSMRLASRNQEFEKAADLRNKIFALNHIQDIALISNSEPRIQSRKPQNMRIEAYDISNLSGQQAVGSLVVFSGTTPDKSQYRKFRIKTVIGSDDVTMMGEVLRRRFANNWPLPDLLILDGGLGHLRMAERIMTGLDIGIPLIAVAKGAERKKTEVVKSKRSRYPAEIEMLISNQAFLKSITDEAHRFAIGYHRKLRQAAFLAK